ncbi:cation:dicarboxylate symporter family transporter, partial [Escherichia coli]
MLSLTLGLVMVTLLQPGVGLSLSLPDDTASSGVVVTAISLKDFVTHAIPKSVVEAMATNEILQIVVFSLFFGLAVACSTLLGHRLGAEEYEAAWQHSQLFLLLA